LRQGPFLAAIETHQPAVIFLAYPNNPTGNLFDRGAIEAIIERAPGVVVLDEAYAPFAKTSFMADLARFPNLLVMRTVSKLGLAGLRLGLLAGHPAWVEQLGKLRLPYNINALTQISAEFALEHYDELLAQTEAILAERAVVFRALSAINQIQVWPSEANFLLVRAPAGKGPALVEAIRDRGVLVRNFHGASPLLSDCIRVSMGTPEENQAFLNALRESLRVISMQ
jgi:histidinol-phosphate aminotransferase